MHMKISHWQMFGHRKHRISATALSLIVAVGAGTVNAQQASLSDGHFQSGQVMLTGRSIAPPSSELTNLKALWNAKRWNDLAAAVVQSGHNIDLLWFYLGEAANGLGYADAAKIYYARAVDLATDSTKTHKCAFYTKGAFLTGTDFCSGFTFPDQITGKAAAQPASAPAAAAGVSPDPSISSVDIATLQREFTIIGFLFAGANTCSWPLTDQQKQNAQSYIDTRGAHVTMDQQFQLQYAVREGYRTISQKGQMDFCEDETERKKFDKHAAELWPRGSLAAPSK